MAGHSNSSQTALKAWGLCLLQDTVPLPCQEGKLRFQNDRGQGCGISNLVQVVQAPDRGARMPDPQLPTGAEHLSPGCCRVHIWSQA